MTINISSASRSTTAQNISWSPAVIGEGQNSPPPISEPVTCGLIAASDAIVVLAGGVASAALAHIDFDTSRYLVGMTALLGAFLSLGFWYIDGCYRFDALARFRRGFMRAIRGLATMIAMQFIFAVAVKAVHHSNLVWLLLWFTSAAMLLAISRFSISAMIGSWRRTGRLNERVAIVGATALARTLIGSLRTDIAIAGQPQIVGVFDDRHVMDWTNRRAEWKGRPLATTTSGTVDDLIGLIRKNRIDSVIIAISLAADERIGELMAKFRYAPVDVRLCPDQAGLQLGHFNISRLGRHSMLNAIDKPLRHWRKVAKDIEDAVLGFMILALIMPVMAAVALAIKLDSPGPVLFRQKRLGYNNQLIDVLKFRTMHQSMCDANAERLTSRNDPRVTKIGAFLRRTSLDELPQFINVLRGDMSIVGPRPHALSAKAGGVMYRDAVPIYDARHRMKPGITGWAQVNGWRGETRTVEQIEKRVEHDLTYVESWSVVMDLKIIARTIFGGFTGTSAY